MLHPVVCTTLGFWGFFHDNLRLDITVSDMIKVERTARDSRGNALYRAGLPGRMWDRGCTHPSARSKMIVVAMGGCVNHYSRTALSTTRII